MIIKPIAYPYLKLKIKKLVKKMFLKSLEISYLIDL